MTIAAHDRTDRFEGSIAALGRVTATSRGVPAERQDESLGAELASSLMLLLAVLVPILMVALVTH